MKRYIIGTLILLIALNTAVITVFFFLHTRSAFENMLDRQIADIEQQVTNRLSGFDIVLRPFEKAAAAYNERINPRIYREIRESAGDSPLSLSNDALRRIAAEYPEVDIYLIDGEGVVRKSTLQSDIGLKLTALEPSFNRFIESLYGSGRLATQRLSLSNMTGKKMIYSYFSPEGSRWILETSVDFTRFMKRRYSPRLYRHLFEDYFSQIQREHNSLVDFDIVHQTSESSRSLLDGASVPISPQINEALQDRETVRRRGETLTVFRRYTMEELEYDFVQQAVARFEYDLSYYFGFMNRLYQISGIIVAGLIILFSLITYLLVDKKLVRRIGQLKEVMAAAAGGDYRQRVTYSSRIGEMDSLATSANHLIDTIEKREAALRSSLSERETLLNEIHHRVKNNLNVVVSLINLQAQQISSVEQAREAFLNTHSRIYTMALTHEMLYQSEKLSEINMHSYLETFLARFRQQQEVRSAEITITTRVDDVLLDISYAVPCGIIIHELLSNSFKHAFPGAREGHVELDFQQTAEAHFRLAVKDDGVGMPELQEGKSETTLGIPLIRSLTEQIGGTLQMQGSDGVHCTITFSTAS